MENKDVVEKIKELEEELNMITSQITKEDIMKANEEEKIKYIEAISEIREKIEMLKNI